MRKTLTGVVILLLMISCFVAFGRITGNDFINFDDDRYITENSHVQSGLKASSIQWAFGSVVASNWHPLTMLSHMLDWQLFGANASGHHLVSLLFHIGAVILLFLFLLKTTHELWPSAFAAAFFALHPLRVESVAWASERKDVLSMFFGMASLYAYAFYGENKKTSPYLLCLFLFILSLMSKPMLVTLPFVFLLVDVWPLKRLPISKEPSSNLLKTAGKLLLEKIPFFFFSFASCMITLWAQWETSVRNFSFFLRIQNAIVSYATYIVKTFLPVNLAIFYPFVFSLLIWRALLSLFFTLGMTFLVFYYLKKLPFLLVGWLWYLGTLIPVIGLVQVGSQAAADRYTYLPSIGIAIMLSWGMAALIERYKIPFFVSFSIAIGFLSVFGVLSFHQCGYWKNSISLFSHAVKVTDRNDMAHNNLGSALFYEGKIDEALEHFTEAIRIAPEVPMPYYNRGTIYAQQGRYPAAIHDFTMAISLMPNQAQIFNNRGVAYTKMDLYSYALDDFNQAIRLEPNSADIYNNRAVVFFKQHNLEQGCADVNKACELNNCRKLEVARLKGFCN